MSWPKEDMFAVTVDGKVLLNAKAFEGADLQKLARRKGVFVGVPLSKREVKLLGEHAYDMSAEVAATIVAGRGVRYVGTRAGGRSARPQRGRRWK